MNALSRPSAAKLARIAVLVAIAIVLALTVDFGRRAVGGYQYRRKVAELQEEVEAARKRQQELLAYRDYVLSDAYVERWAREKIKLVRGDETLVIVVPVEEGVQPESSTPSAREWNRSRWR